MSAKRVGFIGLGTMGRGMVASLLDAGFEVCGFNRSAAAGEALVAKGMRQTATPREAVAGADLVFTCVSDDDALRSVAQDAQTGLVAGLATGAVWIECGTTGLDLTEELAVAARQQGASFLGAPITGSKLGAEGGRLTYMIGGPSEALEIARAALDATSRHVAHVGEGVTMGQRAKYCLNMTQAVVLEGVLEGYALAKSLGVPMAAMSEIFENSAGKTGVGSFKTPYLERGDFEPHFKLWLMQKDLHIALGEASRNRVVLPAASAVRNIYDQGVAEGLGDEDFLVLAKLLERWGGFRYSDGEGS